MGAEIQKIKSCCIPEFTHVFLHCESEGGVLILSWELPLRVKTLDPLPSLGGGKGLRNWVNVTFPSYTANREP